MEPLSLRALNRATLARQLLLERHALGVDEAVPRLGALQAQRPRAPYVALAARLEGFERDHLTAALREQRLLRATLMRATLHLVPAGDYAHFAGALRPWLRTVRAQYLPEGVTIERVAELAEAAVELAREPVGLQELRAGLRELEPHVDDDRVWWRIRFHAPLVHVANDERFGFGARTLVRAPDGTPPEGASLAPLVRRHLAAFGPATRADVAAWLGPTVGSLAGALDELESELERLADERGRELLDLRGAPRPPAGTPAPLRLLGEWDSLLLAHADRTRVISDEARKRAIRKNGDVLPTILLDGFVAGTWWWERKRSVATLLATPFEPLPKRALGELEAEAARVLRVLEPQATEFRVAVA